MWNQIYFLCRFSSPVHVNDHTHPLGTNKLSLNSVLALDGQSTVGKPISSLSLSLSKKNNHLTELIAIEYWSPAIMEYGASPGVSDWLEHCVFFWDACCTQTPLFSSFSCCCFRDVLLHLKEKLHFFFFSSSSDYLSQSLHLTHTICCFFRNPVMQHFTSLYALCGLSPAPLVSRFWIKKQCKHCLHVPASHVTAAAALYLRAFNMRHCHPLVG